MAVVGTTLLLGFLSAQGVHGVPWGRLPVKVAAEHTHYRQCPSSGEAHRVRENKTENFGHKMLNAEEQVDNDNQHIGSKKAKF